MELRPYQKAAIDGIQSQWQSGNRRTLLVLPTGCGKTIVFCKLAEQLVRQGHRVLIIAHRGELLEQAADKLYQATGLRCATEKAEETCLGSWYRVAVDLYRACSGQNDWSNSQRIILHPSLWMRLTIACPMGTSGFWGTSQMQMCWG